MLNKNCRGLSLGLPTVPVAGKRTLHYLNRISRQLEHIRLSFVRALFIADIFLSLIRCRHQDFNLAHARSTIIRNKLSGVGVPLPCDVSGEPLQDKPEMPVVIPEYILRSGRT